MDREAEIQTVQNRIILLQNLIQARARRHCSPEANRYEYRNRKARWREISKLQKRLKFLKGKGNTMKIFWFDVETTGTDPVKNDITQLAAMIEIDGKLMDAFYQKVKPIDMESINPEALDVQKVTIDELESYQGAAGFFRILQDYLSKYVNKYDPDDKFTIAGYNVKFDQDFLYQFFQKLGNKYFGSFFRWNVLDVMQMNSLLEYVGAVELSKTYKLAAIARKYLGKDIDAHNPTADIMATREIFFKQVKILQNHLKETGFTPWIPEPDQAD